MRFLLIVALSLISSALSVAVPQDDDQPTVERRAVLNSDNTTMVDKGISASDAIDATMTIIKAVQSHINSDKAGNAKYLIEYYPSNSSSTQDLVSKMRHEYPSFNWVICHTKHTYKFDGRRGVDWDHKHQEFELGSLFGTTGYEIYNFKGGEFTRQGDGGYLNWAYYGNVLKSDQGGKHLVFSAP
ncbi:hypothetical protein ONZ45_g3110 [Pleurotus djamor]|nr:hypothetical protein ONZ45_g3110 [Pleurotus djamor]